MKVWIFLFCIIVFVIISFYVSNNREAFDYIPNQEIVISRYNETLNWINDPPFNKHPCIIYNKGNNGEFRTNSNVKEIKNLPNVGREIHTYLYHIIMNYENLSDVTIFLPGSVQLANKYKRAQQMIYAVEKSNNTVLACTWDNSFNENDYDFTLDAYASSCSDNRDLNNDDSMEKSKIRPYGKWYTNNFEDKPNLCITWNALVSISKLNILQHPRSYYYNLIQSLSSHNNPEAGHYFERSLFAVFSPFDASAQYISPDDSEPQFINQSITF